MVYLLEKLFVIWHEEIMPDSEERDLFKKGDREVIIARRYWPSTKTLKATA